MIYVPVFRGLAQCQDDHKKNGMNTGDLKSFRENVTLTFEYSLNTVHVMLFFYSLGAAMFLS